jgi:hypothetical protein
MLQTADLAAMPSMSQSFGQLAMGDNARDATEWGPAGRPGGSWVRPVTWWAILGFCTSFWYGVLHLSGVV